MPIFWIFLLMLAGPARAEAISLLDGGMFAARAPLTQARHDATGTGPSLFAGRSATGLFAPRTPRLEAPVAVKPLKGSAVDRLRNLIGQAESRRHGYDAVQHGARKRPHAAPTLLTLGDIFAWIDATPGQPHAIGRYQFIPPTLRRLVAATGMPGETPFSPAVQDRLADVLLEEAGLSDAMAGRMPRKKFMHNLARIWAGLPTATGRSFYHGHAGNKATMTWAQFDAEMTLILPG